MANDQHLTEADLGFINNMRVSIQAEMEAEFRDEALLDLETGVKYLAEARTNGDTRESMEIWDEWERKKLEEEDFEDIV